MQRFEASTTRSAQRGPSLGPPPPPRYTGIKWFLLFWEILGWRKDIFLSKIYRKGFLPRIWVAWEEILWPGSHFRIFLFPLGGRWSWSHRHCSPSVESVSVAWDTQGFRSSSHTVCRQIEFTESDFDRAWVQRLAQSLPCGRNISEIFTQLFLASWVLKDDQWDGLAGEGTCGQG